MCIISKCMYKMTAYRRYILFVGPNKEMSKTTAAKINRNLSRVINLWAAAALHRCSIVHTQCALHKAQYLTLDLIGRCSVNQSTACECIHSGPLPYNVNVIPKSLEIFRLLKYVFGCRLIWSSVKRNHSIISFYSWILKKKFPPCTFEVVLASSNANINIYPK